MLPQQLQNWLEEKTLAGGVDHTLFKNFIQLFQRMNSVVKKFPMIQRAKINLDGFSNFKIDKNIAPLNYRILGLRIFEKKKKVFIREIRKNN